MTQTIQLRSCVSLNETSKDLTLKKPETAVEDNGILLLSVIDSLNSLCEKLSKLNYAIQRKNIEPQIFYTEKTKEK